MRLNNNMLNDDGEALITQCSFVSTFLLGPNTVNSKSFIVVIVVVVIVFVDVVIVFVVVVVVITVY